MSPLIPFYLNTIQQMFRAGNRWKPLQKFTDTPLYGEFSWNFPKLTSSDITNSRTILTSPELASGCFSEGDNEYQLSTTLFSASTVSGMVTLPLINK
jgi:hypothetical protein